MTKQYPIYKVRADRTTGEWLTMQELDAQADLAFWQQLEDTDDVHYDTAQLEFKTHDGRLEHETFCVMVEWID